MELLQAKEARLTRQEEFQTAMASHLGHLSTQLKELHGHLAPPVPAAPPIPAAPPTPATPPPTAATVPVQTTPVVEAGSKLAPPAKFSGEMGQCRTFLIDCSIHFEVTPHAFPTDRSKIAFIISHLTGRAKAWASAEWGRSSPLCHFNQDF